MYLSKGRYLNFNWRIVQKLQRAPDRDGDGIRDGSDMDSDQCVDLPEDMDGYRDEDGCPDPDNDGDGVNDDVDQCPMFAEDIDGYQDEDGCPDPDNDQDNILILSIDVPLNRRRSISIKIWTGVQIKDHILILMGMVYGTIEIIVPFHPEDDDGVQDEDGCPDPDAMNEWKEVLNPNTDESTDDDAKE